MCCLSQNNVTVTEVGTLPGVHGFVISAGPWHILAVCTATNSCLLIDSAVEYLSMLGFKNENRLSLGLRVYVSSVLTCTATPLPSTLSCFTGPTINVGKLQHHD
jgi:hypothetical protein